MLDLIKKDAPIEKIDEDFFERKEFVNHILRVINFYKEKENKSIVLGITGEWGSGKSSIINLVKQKLDEWGLITIKFNPLFYQSIEANTTFSFFKEIFNSIKDKKDIFPYLKDSFEKMLNFLKYIPNNYISSGSNFCLEKFFKEKDSLNKLKEGINKSFSELGKKPIIIFIDDLDRLNHEELVSIFQLVKINADFDKVIYVLSYDPKMVCKMLEDQQLGGKEYLKKIVQNEFECPLLTFQQKEAYFNKTFAPLYEIITNLNSDEESLRRSLYPILSKVIKTPRDIIRLYNKVISDFFYIHRKTSAKEVESLEIDLEDLFLLDILKINYPEIYQLIYENKEIFIEDEITFFKKDSEREEMRKYISNQKDEKLNIILKQLFPPLYNLKIEDKKIRIWKRKYFEVYFSMNYKESELTQEDYNQIIKSLKNKEELLKIFELFIEKNKFREVLGELFTNIHGGEINDFENLKNLCDCLIKVAPNLDNTYQTFLLNNLNYAVEIIIEIIKSSKNEKQLSELFGLILNKKNNWTIPLYVVNALALRIKREDFEKGIRDIIPIESLKIQN
jgi:predicted KAP-like P-loop ATPase